MKRREGGRGREVIIPRGPESGREEEPVGVDEGTEVSRADTI